MWGGDILSTVGDVQYREGYHEYCGGYIEYRGDTQYRGAFMMNMGDIMSPVGVFSTMGDAILCNLSTMGDIMIPCRRYHEYHGGTQITKDFFPTILNTPTVLMISPTVLKITSTVLMIIPTVFKISSTFIIISPTVLNIPHGVQDIP